MPLAPRRVLVALVLAVALTAVLVVPAVHVGHPTVPAVLPGATGSPHPVVAAGAHTVTADVTVTSSPLPGTMRAGSIGLSVELRDLLGSAAFSPGSGLAPLLAALGPSVLRVGGDTADRPRTTPLAPTRLGPLATLLARSGWRTILTLDLGHYSAVLTTADASSLHAALGSRLAGLACGNEPDLYAQDGLRPPGTTAAQVVAQARTCLAAARAAAPGVSLVGPDALTGPWLLSYATAVRGLVAQETMHFYPTTACPLPGRRRPTSGLLSERVQRLAVGGVTRVAAHAHASGLSLRVDETNSASCGGTPGVSDAYASALWGADAMATLLASGADGVNVHTIPTAAGCTDYSPVCLPHGQRTVHAQPLYDGLLLAHDLGVGRFLRVDTTAPTVRAHAVRHPGGGLGVMLVNDSAASLRVRLHVTGVGGAPARGLLMGDPGGLGALGGAALTPTVVRDARSTAGGTTYTFVLPGWSARVVQVPAAPVATHTTAAPVTPGEGPPARPVSSLS